MAFYQDEVSKKQCKQGKPFISISFKYPKPWMRRKDPFSTNRSSNVDNSDKGGEHVCQIVCKSKSKRNTEKECK